MRWVTYDSVDSGERVGLVQDGMIYALAPGVTLLDLLDQPDGLVRGGGEAVSDPLEVVPLNGARLRAPLQPRSIRDCTGFLQHMRNCSGAANLNVDYRFEQFPAFYFTNPAAVIGPCEEVPISPGSSMFDFELEVAAVIGKAGASIPLDEAEGYIAGYLLLWDWSARDLQLQEMPMSLGPAKGKDGATTLGPMLVTPDELTAFRSRKAFDLRMTGYVNGELVSDGRWNTVDWGFPDMITYASRGTRIRPGDVIGSGTVPTGCLFEHYAADPDSFRGWLQPGDEVRLVVEQLGEITHRVVEGEPVRPLSSGY